MATSEPVTPSKDRGAEPGTFLQDLNVRYNLGIPVLQLAVTPRAIRQDSQRDTHLKRYHAIQQLVRYLYWNGKDKLDAIVADFDTIVRHACRNWVPKPRADKDLLPTSSDPPQASGEKQQIDLQIKLLSQLEEAKSGQRRPLTRSATTALSSLSFSAPSTTPSISPEKQPTGPSRQLRKPKRRSEDETDQDGAIKRAKGVENVEPFVPMDANAATDRVMMRSKTDGPDLLFSSLRPRPLSRSTLSSNLASGNTSRASLHSKVFSVAEDDDALPDSQVTVPDDSQTQKRVLEMRGRLDGPRVGQAAFIVANESQSSYAPSPETHHALEASWRTPTKSMCELPGHQPSSGTRSQSLFSSFPDLADLPDPDIDTKALDSLMLDADENADSPDLVAAQAQIAPRLVDIWPRCPAWLRQAPYPVAWEVTRIALHCGVILEDSEPLSLSEDIWTDQRDLRRVLYRHSAFVGKSFPESSNPNVWKAAISPYVKPGYGQARMGHFESSHETVVYTAAMDFNKDKNTPLYKLKLQAIKLDQPCRLSRQFGADRFLELLLPSYNSESSPDVFKKYKCAPQALIRWLTHTPHQLAGRSWKAFFTKDGGYRKPAPDFRLGPEPKPIWKDRIYLFAETEPGPLTGRGETVNSMLKWLLQVDRKGSKTQPYLKLFSRIALGLSRTTPTVVFKPEQITHHGSNRLSRTGKVMNDGIGTMSLTVARKIRDILGLKDIPCAVQGRLGSAKGMWIIDVNDNGREDWIETYPSQRKWDCDFSNSDANHRTLEIRSHAAELKSARLNLQLLPILEDRAKDKARMRTVISEILEATLNREFESQKQAMSDPLQLRQWVQENSSSSRQERVLHNGIPFTGGLPSRDEETISFLLDAGFEPKRQKYLQELAWTLQKNRCDHLKDKMNIRIGQSAYIYMVVDFENILEENEVHVCFSSKFRDDESQFSDICLDGIDVLVTRSPAHFASDIQRVKAVFKPELRALQDVIVFPLKGNAPLADKLSGGDYDGDMAWVCWDQRIVDNFVNADVPVKPRLFKEGYLRKVNGTMEELQRRYGKDAIGEMVERSFEFNMRENFLGRCTNYKERMTYKRRTISDNAAVMLSELVSNLVDQAKQGIDFTTADWSRLLRDLGEPFSLPEPGYKSGGWDRRKKIHNIIDHLKFNIVVPAVARELKAFHQALNPQVDRSPTKSPASSEQKAEFYDEDLVRHAKFLALLAAGSKSMTDILDSLRHDVRSANALWVKLAGERATNRDRTESFPQHVQQVYDQWCAIVPHGFKEISAIKNSKTVAMLWPQHLKNELSQSGDWDLKGLYLHDAEHSEWALYRASVAFQLYYRDSPVFVWKVAGRQLARIKATSGTGPLGVMIRPMYAASKLDTTTAKQMIARMEGHGSQYHGQDFGERSFVDELDDFDEESFINELDSVKGGEPS